MGKVHEALKKANSEMRVVAPVTPVFSSEKKPARNEGPVSFEVLNKSLTERKLNRNLISYFEPQSHEAELFKMLRTNILFPKKGKPPRSIMVTSPMPEEGKSFVSANLAISIAQGVEEHVMLMDCDMRRSCQHKLFGFDEMPGLSEYLSKGASLSSLLVKTSVNKLSLLPGGTPPPNPSELLSSQPMAQLLSEVKSRYSDRYIIVDSPPPHLTSETSALAKSVDAVVLVVRSEKTPKGLAKEIIEKLGRDKIIGVVLNWFKIKGAGYYNYGKKQNYFK